jgi:hypothetical protein
VEAHLGSQIEQCRAGLPTQRRMPDQPPLHDPGLMQSRGS